MKKTDNRVQNILIIAIIATIVMLIATITPHIYNLIISFKNYSPAYGTLSSPWVELKNYEMFKNSVYFSKVIKNSLVQNGLYVVFLVAISTLVGAATLSIPKRNFLRHALITLLLLIAFVPESVYSQWWMRVMRNVYSGTNDNPFFIPSKVIWLLPLIKAIKMAGIPVFIASLLYKQRVSSSRFLLPMLSAACVGLFAFIFVSDNNLGITMAIYNPTVYEVTHNFDTYSFHQGIISGQFSYAAAITTIRQLISLGLTVIFIVPLTFIIKRLFTRTTIVTESDSIDAELPPATAPEPEKITASRRMLASALAIVSLLIIYVIPMLISKEVMLNGEVFNAFISNTKIAGIFTSYLPLCLTSAVICTGISILLAYPVIIAKSNIRRISLILLLAISFCMATTKNIGAFLVLRTVGVQIDSPLAKVLCFVFSTMGAWALIGAVRVRSPEHKNGNDYFTIIRRPAIVLTLGLTAMFFGYYTVPYIGANNTYDMYFISTALSRNFSAAQTNASGTSQNISSLHFLLSFSTLLVPTLLVGGVRCFMDESDTASLVCIGLKR